VALKGQDDPINAFQAEIAAAVSAVKTGVVPSPLDGQLARDALVMCLKEIESVETGKTVIVSRS